MTRTVSLMLVGLLIVGVATALAAFQVDCPSCGSDGRIECSACNGFGATYFAPFFGVECPCQGKDPDCALCEGQGIFIRCEVCEGKGGTPCRDCGGRGKLRVGQYLLRLLNLR